MTGERADGLTLRGSQCPHVPPNGANEHNPPRSLFLAALRPRRVRAHPKRTHVINQPAALLWAATPRKPLPAQLSVISARDARGNSDSWEGAARNWHPLAPDRVQSCRADAHWRLGRAWPLLSPPQSLVRVLMTGNCQQQEREGEGRKGPEVGASGSNCLSDSHNLK